MVFGLICHFLEENYQLMILIIHLLPNLAAHENLLFTGIGFESCGVVVCFLEVISQPFSWHMRRVFLCFSTSQVNLFVVEEKADTFFPAPEYFLRDSAAA